jgi:hypothetical protein
MKRIKLARMDCEKVSGEIGSKTVINQFSARRNRTCWSWCVTSI